MSRRGRRADRTEPVEHVAVVGDEEQLRRELFAAVRPAEAEIERRGSRPEQFRQHLVDGLELRIAIGVRLDDLRVDAEGDVVDEDAIVDERKVDATFDRCS